MNTSSLENEYTKFSLQELVEKIIEHRELYANGNPQISDEEYDLLEDRLRYLDPENKVLEKVWSRSESQNIGKKIKHQVPMLSLRKTYAESELIDWIADCEVLSIEKIDGVSCSLIYREGKLVLAKTRGDGEFGEDITQHVSAIKDIPSLIHENPSKEIEVRGEIFCRESNFHLLVEEMKKLGLNPPQSKRNIVAGLMSRKEQIQLTTFLSFKAFDLLCGDLLLEKEHKKLELLKSMGFIVPKYEFHSREKLNLEILQHFKKFMQEGDYQIDGVVFIYNDLRLHEQLGSTAHHPRYKIAFKFQGLTARTTIQQICWGMSRNGILTPVALVTPTQLSGAVISRVTLHNAGMLNDFDIAIGDEIEILRSGEVIPKFQSILKKGSNHCYIPSECPFCRSKLSLEEIRLKCLNVECSEKRFYEFLYYIQQSGIEDLSEQRLREILDKKLIVQLRDLYLLKEDDFLQLDKVKEKLASKLWRSIQNSKKISLKKFMTSIGPSGVSSVKIEKCIAAGFRTLDQFLSCSIEELCTIDGFAEKSARDLIDSLNEKKELIAELLAVGIEVQHEESFDNKQNQEKLTLKDINFCITGELSSPRKLIEGKIKDLGGKIQSSVTSKTHILITNETNSTSSKFLKAKELNLKILTEEQLEEFIQEKNT